MPPKKLPNWMYSKEVITVKKQDKPHTYKRVTFGRYCTRCLKDEKELNSKICTG